MHLKTESQLNGTTIPYAIYRMKPHLEVQSQISKAVTIWFAICVTVNFSDNYRWNRRFWSTIKFFLKSSWNVTLKFMSNSSKYTVQVGCEIYNESRCCIIINLKWRFCVWFHSINSVPNHVDIYLWIELGNIKNSCKKTQVGKQILVSSHNLVRFLS